MLSKASCMGKLVVVSTELQSCNIARSEPKEGLRYLKQELGRYLAKKMYRMFSFGAGHSLSQKVMK